MNKKKLSIIAGCLILLIIGLVTYLIQSVPHDEIHQLKKGYVAVKWLPKDKKVDYKIVDKKPKNWLRLKEIPPQFYQAIVISEDWGFFQHNGVDIKQLEEAVTDTINNGKRLRGASTISQQVVKNLFLDSERSYWRKFREYIITYYLERDIEKKKILEVYLNIIEFGPGIYGVENASQYYFKRSAKSLGAREGAFLAMLLPSPKRYGESFRKKQLTPFAKRVMRSILEKMTKAGFITKDQMARELKRDFGWEKRVKQAAPHQQKFKNDDDGEDYEKRYRTDSDVQLDDRPGFDGDALIEDQSGLEEEIRVDED